MYCSFPKEPRCWTRVQELERCVGFFRAYQDSRLQRWNLCPLCWQHSGASPNCKGVVTVEGFATTSVTVITSMRRNSAPSCLGSSSTGCSTHSQPLGTGTIGCRRMDGRCSRWRLRSVFSGPAFGRKMLTFSRCPLVKALLCLTTCWKSPASASRPFGGWRPSTSCHRRERNATSWLRESTPNSGQQDHHFWPQPQLAHFGHPIQCSQPGLSKLASGIRVGICETMREQCGGQRSIPPPCAR